jgi:hypothetical protein
MLRNRIGQIITGEVVSAATHAFYVSVINAASDQSRLVLGPFATNLRASLRVRRVMRFCISNYRDGHWFAYGTCGIQPNENGYPVGVLNDVLGFTPQPIDDSAPVPASFTPIDRDELRALRPDWASDVFRAIGALDDVWQVDAGHYAFRGESDYYYAVDLYAMRELGHRILMSDIDHTPSRDAFAQWLATAPLLQLTERPPSILPVSQGAL